ncbi:MAG: ATP-binding protein [Reichenbachiella sp.]|uniref:sensor histidine kinase n=3 Tax=Reichenbachiella sp. TaxID=2184521 RepID=UPI00326684EB
MVTIWNFDTITCLTALVAAVGIMLIDQQALRPLHQFISRIGATMDRHVIAKSSAAVRRRMHFSSIKSWTWLQVKTGVFFIVGILTLGYLLTPISSDWTLPEAIGTISIIPVFLLFSHMIQKSNSQTLEESRPASERKGRVAELEGLLYTAELTLLHSTRSLKQVEEKLKFEENLRKKAERQMSELVKPVTPEDRTVDEVNQLLISTEEMANMGSWEWEPEQDELYWTKGVYKIHETQAGTKLSMNESLRYIHPDYYSIVQQAFNLAASRNKPFDIEIKLITARKRSIWVRIIGTVALSKNKVKKIQGLYINVDHEKKAEEALINLTQNLNKKAESLNEDFQRAQTELEDFCYSVSHDLRAPMRVIDGFSTILTEDYVNFLDPEGMDTIETIQLNVTKMNQMMNEILTFSSINRKNICKAEIDPHIIIKEILNETKDNQSVEELTFNVQDRLPNITGDRSLIKQVFTNLIDNAIKFSSNEKGLIIEIGSMANPDRGMTRFFVKDNGIGFDMKFHTKLFKAFKRLHKQSEIKGSGMGLTLAKKIIEKHGGKIWGESESGHGTTMYFTLPASGTIKSSNPLSDLDFSKQSAELQSLSK